MSTESLDLLRARALLEEAPWIRRLARRLVTDADLAEDLSQDTWVRALEHGPRVDQPLRGWLATVMKNLLRQRRRGDGRRQAREEVSARAEGVEASPGGVLERVSTHRALVEAVLELGEPYRTTMLLRWFDGLSPKDIARELGLSRETVKTRLSRGLAELRERLDREHGGDRRAWLSALVPLFDGRPWTAVGGGSAWTPSSLGALIVNAKLVLSLVCLSAIGTTFVVFSQRKAPAPVGAQEALAPVDEELAARLATPPDETGHRAEALEPLTAAAATSRTAQREAQDAPAPEVAAGIRVHGLVLDQAARPVPGVRVVRAGSARAEEGGATGARGRFEFEVQGGGGRFVVDDERFTTVLSGGFVPVSKPGAECVVVVAPRVTLAGRVIDELGRAVPEADLALVLPEGFRARFTTVLDHSTDLAFGLRADADGRFDWPGVPAIEGARLRAAADGFEPATIDAPAFSELGLVLVLAAPEFSAQLLRGTVVDSFASPVPGATVALGFDTTVSDREGRFVFDLSSDATFGARLGERIEIPDDELVALKPGYLPGRSVATGRDDEGRPRWPDEVVLQLGSEPLELAGRVVDAEGAPLAGIYVWIADPTFFGGLGNPATDERPALVHAETLLAGGDPGWHRVETDATGRFTITGLLDREYSVHAMDPTTLARVVSSGVSAGKDDLVLRFDTGLTFPVLRGRVVDQLGRPVPDVSIYPMNDAFVTRFRGQRMSTRHAMTDGVLTDADGRFTLHDVPRDLAYLRLNGADTIPEEYGRGVEGGLATLIGDDSERVEIHVQRRCHFKVELAAPDEADRIGVLDEAGELLVITQFMGSSRRDTELMDLVDGVSNTLVAPGAARTLALYRGEELVRTVPIRLEPGEVVILRP